MMAEAGASTLATTVAPPATFGGDASSPSVVLPPFGMAGTAPSGVPEVRWEVLDGPEMPAHSRIAKTKVLILCDENLVFSAGIQEAYPDLEFTAATVLGRPDLEKLNFDPSPRSLMGRVQHLVDPTKLNTCFLPGEFDALMLFLPGLASMVPTELGTADCPLFAFRVHWLFFHIVRHAKVLLKMENTKLHLVWPDESGLMTSPCGAAGIEIPQLAAFCGCKSLPQEFDMMKVEANAFWPFLFGSVPSEPPEWLSGTTIQSFTYDKSSIPVPLSVALMLHPDVTYACIKDPNEFVSSPGPNAPFRSQLQHEMVARGVMFGHKENPADVVGAFDESVDEDSLLSLPREVFMLSLDAVPHLSNIMEYKVIADQTPGAIPTLEVLDPRLPSQTARSSCLSSFQTEAPAEKEADKAASKSTTSKDVKAGGSKKGKGKGKRKKAAKGKGKGKRAKGDTKAAKQAQAEAAKHEAILQKKADAITVIAKPAIDKMEAALVSLKEAAAPLTENQGSIDKLQGFATPVSVQDAVKASATTLKAAVEEAKKVVKKQQEHVAKAVKGPLLEAKEELQRWLEAASQSEHTANEVVAQVQTCCNKIANAKFQPTAVALRADMQSSGEMLDAFFKKLAGKKEKISEEAFVKKVQSLQGLNMPFEHAKLVSRKIECGGIGHRSFMQFAQQYYKVIEDIAITSVLDVVGSKEKPLRKAECDEVFEVLQGPQHAPCGLERVKVRALTDGVEGWVSVNGNEGKIFLQDVEKPFYQCLKDTPLGTEFASGSVEVRTVKSDEVLELIEGPRQEELGSSLMRIRGKAVQDGKIGWFSLKDRSGTVYAEKGNKCYTCVKATGITDQFDIKSCKVLKKLVVDEVFAITEGGPVCDIGSGLERVKGKRLKDGVEGWITIKGNQGTVFAKVNKKPYIITKEAAMQSSFASCSPVVRTLAAGEVVEVMEGPREEMPANRAKVRTSGDGAVGWISVRPDNVRPWTGAQIDDAVSMVLQGHEYRRQNNQELADSEYRRALLTVCDPVLGVATDSQAAAVEVDKVLSEYNGAVGQKTALAFALPSEGRAIDCNDLISDFQVLVCNRCATRNSISTELLTFRCCSCDATVLVWDYMISNAARKSRRCRSLEGLTWENCDLSSAIKHPLGFGRAADPPTDCQHHVQRGATCGMAAVNNLITNCSAPRPAIDAEHMVGIGKMLGRRETALRNRDGACRVEDVANVYVDASGEYFDVTTLQTAFDEAGFIMEYAPVNSVRDSSWFARSEVAGYIVHSTDAQNPRKDHWFALRLQGTQYFLQDSLFEKVFDLTSFEAHQLCMNIPEGELFMVSRKPTEEASGGARSLAPQTRRNWDRARYYIWASAAPCLIGMAVGWFVPGPLLG